MTATAAAKPRTMASAWKSPAATYYLLAASAGILLIVGLASVLSSSSIESLKATDGNPYKLFFIQLAAFTVGLIALVIGSRLPVIAWKRLAPWVLYSSIGLLLVVAAAGMTLNGNRNWIKVGLVTFQPSEVAKLGLALYLGVVLARFRKHLTTWKQIFVPGGIMSAIVIGLVLYGHDMGTAIVLVVIVVAAYWIAGLPLRFFVMAGIVGLIGVLALVAQGETRTARIETWLNPANCDIQDACMQSTHALWALASGGVWGLGPGMSREKWGGGLPVADSDMIFGIIGEEFGLIGTLLVLFAFGMMIVAVNRIVHRSRDPFVQIAGGAIGAWIIGQACINIAVVVGLLPVTGLPLPLVSSGGSSLIASMTAIGVLMAFARAEPGAAEAFAARPSVVRRSLTVLSGGRRG
ncbi:FtsW/RodA/SpoVE family cell cycle protein [Demequina sp.]|uniref:FtsW/RodA/SpoVE family cell cycle protein n=1 Tax=Demequina sp. TaxID=2050685 RepID=UPI003D0D6C9D